MSLVGGIAEQPTDRELLVVPQEKTILAPGRNLGDMEMKMMTVREWHILESEIRNYSFPVLMRNPAWE